jgi:2,4-dienoyl-CoA reductase-like NADH-dependent reductase (Old Yellow Enzyme family)
MDLGHGSQEETLAFAGDGQGAQAAAPADGTQSALSPLTLAGFPLDNRLAFVATVNNLGLNREITDELVAFYEARAAGGTGLIITEGMSVHPTSIPNPTVPIAYEPEMIPGFTRIADAVHRHGSAIYGQLWHVGRQALWNLNLQPWAVSGERDPYSGATPHVMTDAEILEIVEGFAVSAANLQEAGFDGVELHGAHGYLITQFLSPWSNTRTDRWGGSMENRARFVVEVTRAINARCGEDFAVGLKLTVHEYVEGGLDLEQSQALVQHLLDEVSLAFIAVSQANFSPSLEYHVPDQRFPDVPFEELSRGIHEAVAGRTPVMALAKIPDVATASRLIDTGAAELIGMSRALLADAAIVNKARSGETPRPCIYCSVCWERIHTGRAVHCIYAPETGREAELAAADAAAGPVPPDASPQRIRVLGAGPGGLEYARVAAGRGHEVEVLERSDRTGGRFRNEAEVDGLDSYALAADWMTGAARDAGAEIVLEADDADGATEDVDLLVVAIGAEPIVAPLGTIPAFSLEAALAAPETLADPVFVVDEIEAEPVYAAVEQLVAAGRDVRLITRRATIGRRIAYINTIGALRRLDGLGVPIHTLLAPTRVEGGRLIATHNFSRREHDLGPIGSVVRAGPYAARAVPAAVADNADTIVIGDASAPREALAVVLEAHDRARELPDISLPGASPDRGARKATVTD